MQFGIGIKFIDKLFEDDDVLQFGTSFTVYKNGKKIEANAYEYDENEAYFRARRKSEGEFSKEMLKAYADYKKDPNKFVSALSPRGHFVTQHYNALYGKEMKIADTKRYYYTNLTISIPPL